MLIDSRKTRGIALASLFALLLVGCAANPPQDNESTDRRLQQLQGDGLKRLAATLSPVKTADQAIALGDQAAARGEREEAILQYVRAIEFQPKDPETLHKIGVLEEQLGDLSLAALGYRMALEVNESYVPANESLGLLLLKTRNFEQAKEHFERATQADPERWRSHNGLGILADLDGKFSEATQHYERAIALKPGSAMLLSNLGYSYYLQGNFAEAKTTFERALAAEPRYFIARRNLAIIHVRYRQFDKALRLLAMNNNEAAAYNDLGYLCILTEEYAAARKFLNRAIRLSPVFYARAHENLEYLERRESQRADAAAPAPPASLSGEIQRPEAVTIAAPPRSEPTPVPVPPTPSQSPETPAPVAQAASPEDSNTSSARPTAQQGPTLEERLRATETWLHSEVGNEYTIQLMTAEDGSQADLEEFLAGQRARGELQNTYVHENLVNGRKQFYVLFKGFAGFSEAAKVASELPTALQTYQPYVRRLSDFRS